jgi:hypothetical protein
MSMSSQLHRRVGFFIAGGLCLTLIGQVTAAVGIPVKHHASGFHACATVKRALKLTSKGNCPKGSHRVTVGATGARGPSDVYVSSKRNNAPLTKPAIKVRLPAGHYLESWTVEAGGQFSNPGAPTGQQYHVHLYCVPGIEFDGAVGTFGQDDTEDVTIEPDDYSVPLDLSEFTYTHTLTGQWAVTVESKEFLVVSCNISASDGDGNSAGPDSQYWDAQIVATKTSAIHTVAPSGGN